MMHPLSRANQGLPRRRGSLARARYALTFDDGPGPSTEALLDCLEAAGVRATFFILGANVEEASWCGGNVEYSESIVLRILEEGHLLGNHTWTHLSFAESVVDLPSFRADLLRGERMIRRLLGKAGLRTDAFVPFRLPFGPQLIIGGTPDAPIAADPRLEELRALGLTHTHWSGVFSDWEPIVGGAENLCHRLCEHTLARAAEACDAVLLLHDGSPPQTAGTSAYVDRSLTVEGVRRFLERAQELDWCHFTFPAPPEGSGH